ncbi:hypothetical protein BDW66DRAFT_143818 [Aspergillus desertorum]
MGQQAFGSLHLRHYYLISYMPAICLLCAINIKPFTLKTLFGYFLYARTCSR